MTLIKSSLLTALAITFCSPVTFADDHKHEGEPTHKEMQADHEKAEAEHREWADQIAEARIEHRRALATLMKVQAAILEHDTELMEIQEEIRRHREHGHEHETEIAEHEGGNEDVPHDELTESHVKYQKQHAMMAKRMKAATHSHEELMEQIAELLETLEEVHGHHHHDDDDDHDHDHDDDDEDDDE